VPRPPSAEIALRNQQIYALWRDGASLKELAEQFDRTPQLIGRILAAFHPDLDDEDDRALHRGRLESLYQDVQEVIRNPGFMMAPNGRPATGPDGEPVLNTGTRIEAARTQLAVLESMRKLDGRDKPVRRIHQVEHSLAEQQAAASLAELRAQKEAEDRKRAADIARWERLRVIQGTAEPVQRPELPPAAAEG